MQPIEFLHFYAEGRNVREYRAPEYLEEFIAKIPIVSTLLVYLGDQGFDLVTREDRQDGTTEYIMKRLAPMMDQYVQLYIKEDGFVTTTMGVSGTNLEERQLLARHHINATNYLCEQEFVLHKEVEATSRDYRSMIFVRRVPRRIP